MRWNDKYHIASLGLYLFVWYQSFRLILFSLIPSIFAISVFFIRIVLVLIRVLYYDTIQKYLGTNKILKGAYHLLLLTLFLIIIVYQYIKEYKIRYRSKQAL